MDLTEEIRVIKKLNPYYDFSAHSVEARPHRLQKVLVVNRGEIAKRFFFLLKEENIPSVAVVSDPDRGQSWYDFATEVIYIGDAKNYTNINIILAAVLMVKTNAVYPGYGFLSEDARFVAALDKLSAKTGRELIFMGPNHDVMDKLGDKLKARELAKKSGVPLFIGSSSLSTIEKAHQAAEEIGYPVLVKLSAGGGGKGMLAAYNPVELKEAIESAQRIGAKNYDDDSYYLEKLIEEPVHIEVQIFNNNAIGLRKCAVQRRKQKVIEESGHAFLDDPVCLQLFAAAENMAEIAGYGERIDKTTQKIIWGGGAGTVEFLMDAKTKMIGFLEVNTRLQVEYPVTDQSLHIDLAKWQLLYFDGRKDEIPLIRINEQRFHPRQHAMECRIYAEDVYNSYAPAPGVIQIMELPSFNGIRADFGFRSGDRILADYDPMIGKIITRGSNRQEALLRMERALSELYIGGIVTNVEQLLQIVRDPEFIDGCYTNLLLEKPQYQSMKVTSADKYILCAFSSLSYFMYCQEKNIERSFSYRNFATLLSQGQDFLHQLPHELELEIDEQKIKVQLVQLTKDAMSVFINRQYFLTAEVHVRPGNNFSYQIHVGNHSFSVRLDFRPDYLSVRMMDIKTNVKYYRLKIHSKAMEGASDEDNRGLLRCPFQGYFVRFHEDPNNPQRNPIAIGSRVEKGQPIIVIEAMKMETTLTSPLTGVVQYLVEDGDTSRLVRGKTVDGLILGKNLNEGEPLLIVASEEKIKEKRDVAVAPAPVLQIDQASELVSALFSEGTSLMIDLAKKDPEYYFRKSLQLADACLKGLIVDSEQIELLTNYFKQIQKIWHPLSLEKKEELAEEIHRQVEFVIFSRQLISPLIVEDSGYSFFEEMSDFLFYWQRSDYRPVRNFQSILLFLMNEYGYNFDSTQNKSRDFQISYYYVLKAMTKQNVSPLKYLIGLLIDTPRLANKTAKLFRRLLGSEILLREQPLHNVIKEQIKKLPVVSTTEVIGTGNLALSRYYLKEFRKFILHPLEMIEKQKLAQIKAKMSEVKRKTSSDFLSIEQQTPEWVKEQILQRLQILDEKFKINLLPSPIAKTVLIQTTNLDDQKVSFYCFTWLDEGFLDISLDNIDHREKEITSIPNLERAAISIAKVFRIYEVLFRVSDFRAEIFANHASTPFSIYSEDSHVLSAHRLKKICSRVLRFFLHARVKFLLLNILSEHDRVSKQQIISMYTRQGQVCFDLIPEDSPMHPLWHEKNYQLVDPKIAQRTYRLFQQFKWPIEFWARETFDNGSFIELKIPLIDIGNSDTAVAAMIYRGELSNSPALFYMKDSRINGGATGDMEGQKFAIAAYLAYVWDIPLYVFNDGAGANVKQGMVALNRAALGFMLNALTANRVSYADFFARLEQYPDEQIKRLLQAVDQHFGITLKDKTKKKYPQHFFLVAVGIGSSTGLDVYGSSQAAIQVMYDNQASYRVLTGSVVIKSVTGESYTNYEIGGAKVLSENGTIDLSALDKLELISYVRKIQRLFYELAVGAEKPLEILSIFNSYDSPKKIDKFVRLVIDEDILKDLVDAGTLLPFKSKFRQAKAVFTGFARIAGTRCLIVATRTHHGFHTYQALTKTYEALSIAQKTDSPIIIVSGRVWYRPLSFEENHQMSAAADLKRVIRNLRNSKKSPIIQIIYEPEGLMSEQIFGDIVISVIPDLSEQSKHGERVYKFSTFVVKTLRQAFDLSGVILQYLLIKNRLIEESLNEDDVTAQTTSASEGKRRLEIPENPMETFDMYSTVIERVVDVDSFLSFCHPRFSMPDREWTSEWEPNLLIGLALLQGKTVGVIADQCLHGRAPDAPGTERFRIFSQFLTRFNLPLIMLSNAPGFLPGIKQEQLRIQQIGALSLDANVLSTMPVASLVILQNYGGRQIQAFSKFLRPNIVSAAPVSAKLAVMGASASFDLFYGKKYQLLMDEGKELDAAQLRKKILADFNFKSRADQDATKRETVDFTFASCESLRQEIIRALNIARERYLRN